MLPDLRAPRASLPCRPATLQPDWNAVKMGFPSTQGQGSSSQPPDHRPLIALPSRPVPKLTTTTRRPRISCHTATQPSKRMTRLAFVLRCELSLRRTFGDRNTPTRRVQERKHILGTLRASGLPLGKTRVMHGEHRCRSSLRTLQALQTTEGIVATWAFDAPE